MVYKVKVWFYYIKYLELFNPNNLGFDTEPIQYLDYSRKCLNLTIKATPKFSCTELATEANRDNDRRELTSVKVLVNFKWERAVLAKILTFFFLKQLLLQTHV